MWALYEDGELDEDTELSGEFEDSGEAADVDSVLLEIKAVMEEEAARRERIREANEED